MMTRVNEQRKKGLPEVSCTCARFVQVAAFHIEYIVFIFSGLCSVGGRRSRLRSILSLRMTGSRSSAGAGRQHGRAGGPMALDCPCAGIISLFREIDW